MANLKKAASVLAVAALLVAGVRAGALATEAYGSAVSISMPAAQSLVLTVQGGQVKGVPAQGAVLSDEAPSEESLGGLVNNGLNYIERVSVYGRSEGNVGKSVVQEMRGPTAATTTACFFTNTGARARAVTGLGVIDRGTSASAGSVTWTAGTSTVSGGSLGATKAVAATITRISGEDVITTTSTVQTATMLWKANESISFVSGTTTNYGHCYVDYSSL